MDLEDDDDTVLSTKQTYKKLKIRSNRETENHFFFDETGTKRALESLADGSDVMSSDSKLLNLNVDQCGLSKTREQMNKADDEDRELNRQRVKEKHRKKS